VKNVTFIGETLLDFIPFEKEVGNYGKKNKIIK